MDQKDSWEKKRRKGTTANEYRRNEGSQKGRVCVISTGTLFRSTIAGGEAGREAAPTTARGSRGAVPRSRGRSRGPNSTGRNEAEALLGLSPSQRVSPRVHGRRAWKRKSRHNYPAPGTLAEIITIYRSGSPNRRGRRKVDTTPRDYSSAITMPDHRTPSNPFCHFSLSSLLSSSNPSCI